MTEPQVWTLIGVFAAALVGVITIVMTSFTHVLKTSIGAVEKQLVSLEKRMDTRFDAVERRIEHLERDVSYLYRRDFGDPPATP